MRCWIGTSLGGRIRRDLRRFARNRRTGGAPWRFLAYAPAFLGPAPRLDREDACSAQITQVYEGTNQIQRVVIAKALLG